VSHSKKGRGVVAKGIKKTPARKSRCAKAQRSEHGKKRNYDAKKFNTRNRDGEKREGRTELHALGRDGKATDARRFGQGLKKTPKI